MATHQERPQFEFGTACDVGRKRSGELNQDALDVVLPDPGEPWHPPLLLVADGLGRYAGGSLASHLVVKTFKQEFKQAQHPTNYLLLMEQCAQAAHQAVREQGAKEPKLALMGSTIVAVTLEMQQIDLLSIGDSRAYMIRARRIMQISQDQSWVAAQVRAGVLTEQEARVHPNRNRLTMAITAKRSEIESYKVQEHFAAEDIVLLCSDGLWGVVPKALIQATTLELPPQKAAEKLVTLANQRQGPDNISIIIARRVSATGKANVIEQDVTDP